ncbi:hypothetical protein K491DRAFT_673170 [Lophiostoma macrostomum CBS 122681]|uniref:Cupredoxin n=1 Tax=Lophiostoma macrostomum CBS 122681 TaxID=1314788 RepID=A0A6A6TTP9_9PLEO|nr:hypothetical protein K491DRAFT_673170 [Lophiostoma macrostomum CBS 122681]
MRTRLGILPYAMDVVLFLLLGLVHFCYADDGVLPASSSGSNFNAGNPTTTANSQASATSGQAAATHTVQVGNGGFKFTPDSINAAKGDIIEFRFYPANHSVVRAEYQSPCIPYEMTGPNKVGFYAGYHPVSQVGADMPKWSVKINDTNPIFFYCSAPDSCIKYGMVGVINPNPSVNLTLQRQLALSSDFSLNPGDPFPAEGSPSGSLTTMVMPPTSTSSATPTPSSSAPASPSKKLTTGAIAGISVGALSVIALGAGLFFFIGRSNSLKEEISRKASTIRRVSPPRSPLLASQMPMPMQMHQQPNMGPAYYTSPSLGEREKWDYVPGAYGNSAASTPGPGAHELGANAGYFSGTTFGSGGGAGGGVDRSASHRSVGGTFEMSPTGFYTRTSGGQDTFKYANPASPGRGILRSPAQQVYGAGESPVLGREGQQIMPAPWGGAVNEAYPAELEGGFVEGKPF